MALIIGPSARLNKLIKSTKVFARAVLSMDEGDVDGEVSDVTGMAAGLVELPATMVGGNGIPTTLVGEGTFSFSFSLLLPSALLLRHSPSMHANERTPATIPATITDKATTRIHFTRLL